MTPAEREHPSRSSTASRTRAHRYGQRVRPWQDVNRLLKQFEDTRKMMKTVAGGMPKMMRHGKRR